LEIDGEIITVYDAVVHQKVEQPSTSDHDGAGYCVADRTCWWAGS